MIKCCHNWFLKKLKQYINEKHFNHLNFFLCNNLYFTNIRQQTKNLFLKKMFQFPEWSVPNTRDITRLKEIFFQDLADAFLKILFELGLCFNFSFKILNFNFSFKISWPPALSPSLTPTIQPPPPPPSPPTPSPKSKFLTFPGI